MIFLRWVRYGWRWSLSLGVASLGLSYWSQGLFICIIGFDIPIYMLLRRTLCVVLLENGIGCKRLLGFGELLGLHLSYRECLVSQTLCLGFCVSNHFLLVLSSFCPLFLFLALFHLNLNDFRLSSLMLVSLDFFSIESWNEIDFKFGRISWLNANIQSGASPN